jgi:hypothetical protein
MPTIDITLPPELMQALAPPVCSDLQLPPIAAMTPLTLPIGGSLQGVADFTRGLPTDCSMNFSLMLQLAPMMASMECLLKVLKFIGTVVGIIQDITQPMALIQAIPKIVAAAADLALCLDMAMPPFLPTLCFLKDLLALIAKLLLCAVDALQSVLAILSGLQIQIAAAQAAGNGDLLAALTCAQTNASISAAGTMASLQPITVLLSLAGTFMQLAGKSLTISLPSAVPVSDLAAMETMLGDLRTIAQDILAIADALPC